VKAMESRSSHLAQASVRVRVGARVRLRVRVRARVRLRGGARFGLELGLGLASRGQCQGWGVRARVRVRGFHPSSGGCSAATSAPHAPTSAHTRRSVGPRGDGSSEHMGRPG
jgi:hypothetical protein